MLGDTEVAYRSCRRRPGALACLLSIIAVSCAESHSRILEAKDVQSFEVSASRVGEHTRLHISGLAFHSALAVETLDKNIDGEALRLKIGLVLAKPGLSGTFDYAIDVPFNVAYVTFGNSQVVIWRRIGENRQ